MDHSLALLHAGHRGSALGHGVLPGDPVALALIVVGLLLIVGGLYRLHTHEPVEQRSDG